MTVGASSAATVPAAQRFQAAMPDMGASLLATQAMAAPGELLNLSLNASAVLPEGAVLLAMIATLLVDLAGEKVATCLLYTSPSPRDMRRSRMPSSA